MCQLRIADQYILGVGKVDIAHNCFFQRFNLGIFKLQIIAEPGFQKISVFIRVLVSFCLLIIAVAVLVFAVLVGGYPFLIGFIL